MAFVALYNSSLGRELLLRIVGVNLLLSVQRTAQAFRQVDGFAFTPKMCEQNLRLVADHIVVQRDDVDVCFAQCAQHRLHFLWRHGKVAIYGSLLIAAGKCPFARLSMLLITA